MNKVEDLSTIVSLYEGWEESMIWSCFHNVMGDAYADNPENPQSVIVYVNCFAFAAGKPNEMLVADWYDEKVNSFAIITAQDASWHKIFEKVGKEKSRCVERYAIKKEKDIFDIKKLNFLVEQLGKEYELKLIDKELYQQCMKYDWSVDFVQGYPTYEEYQKYGLGVVAI